MSAPQFWLGNQLPADALRRTTLELAHQLPTFQEYSDYMSGAKTLRQIVTDDILNSVTGRDNYVQAVDQWHQNYLALFPVDPGAQTYSNVDPRPVMYQQGSFLGTIQVWLQKFPSPAPAKAYPTYVPSTNSGSNFATYTANDKVWPSGTTSGVPPAPASEGGVGPRPLRLAVPARWRGRLTSCRSRR